MSEAGHVSRRGFLAGGIGAAMMTLAGCGARKVTTSTTSALPVSAATSGSAPTNSAGPSRVGYCNVLSDGQWTGPRDQNGQPDLSLIDDILATTPGCATPRYLRMTSAAASGTQVPGPGTQELQVLQRLNSAGIALGVALDTFPPAANGRSARSVIEQAGQIRAASQSSGGVYDWIFLDNAWNRTPAGHYGLNDLQDIVDAVTAAGWPQVMINATGFNSAHLSDLPERTWAMARHYGLFDGNWQTAVNVVVDTGTGAVTSSDEEFIDYVTQNRHGSGAILKLEIPSDIQRFRLLSDNDQTTLLRLWAQQGPQQGYRNIYPLFIPGINPIGNQATQYDSLTAGTFWEQRSLMQNYG